MDELNKQVADNARDIAVIKNSIKTIETNHLAHVQDSLESLDRRVEKIDNRMWMVLIGVIGSILVPIIVEKLL